MTLKVSTEGIPDWHARMEYIVQELFAERRKQNDLWGNTFDDKNTPNDWVAYICHYAAAGAYDGRDGKYTPERFRKHLKKAACLCIATMEAIDRNQGCAKRHYDEGK